MLNLVCTYVDKPEDKNYHPPPNFTELIRKAEELKAIGNKELLKLDDLMKEHMKTANDIKNIEAKSNAIRSDLKKMDKEAHRQHQVILGRIDIMDKNDEDIKRQIEELKENDKEMKEKLEELGDDNEAIMKKLKEIAQEEENILQQLDTLKKNDKKIEAKMNIFLDNQSKMFEVINVFSEDMKNQYSQLSLYDQEIIKRQVQLGLMQDITVKEIDHFKKMTLKMGENLHKEIIRTQYIGKYFEHVNYLENAFIKFERMNRYSFNLFVNDERMDIFIKGTEELEDHIDTVFKMFTGKGMWIESKAVFEDLNETCSQDYLEKAMFMMKHAIDLYHIRSAMVGNPIRYDYRDFLMKLGLGLDSNSIISEGCLL